jgi:leucyl aminopeptidase (aminopeptidase T)
MFGNLPVGEAYVAPHENVGNGTIVFDRHLVEREGVNLRV